MGKNNKSNRNVSRPKVTFSNATKILSRYIDNSTFVITRFVITIILETAFVLAAPLIIRNITNLYSGDADSINMNSVIILISVLAICYVMGSLMKYINLNLSNSIGACAVKNMRKACREKIDNLPLRYFDSHAIGDILSRVTADMSIVFDALQSTVMVVISAIVTVVTMIVIIFVVKWQLALVFIVLMPVFYLIVMIIASKTRKRFKAQRRLVGQINSYINETCENHTIVEAFDYSNRAEEEFFELNKEFKKKYISGSFQSGFIIPVNTLIVNIIYIVVCVLGAILMSYGMLDLGGLSAFIFYIGMIEAPNRALSFNLVSLQNGLSALERIVEFLDEEELDIEEVEATLSKENAKCGDIDFEHVQFGYLPDKQLMRDVNFHVDSGMKVAVVGPSGAGKTTLVNLLMRFYEIDAGSINIDGQNTKLLSRDNVRDNIGMVLQDSWIFKGSIADNISYGRPDATRDEVIKVAKDTGCASFIEKLPEGYDTIISAEESILSEGQMQLLSIARVALNNPPIMILDEATSQVDTQTESLIMEAIEALMKGKTSFIIAHRLYTIQNSDMILYMENGDILESGTHDELMKQNGRYAAMFRAGFDD